MAELSLSCCTKDRHSSLQHAKAFNCNIWDPVLWPGIELLHWNHGVLAAGPQRKSPHLLVAPSVDRPHLSSQLSYMPTLYLGKTSCSPFATFWTLLKCHFVRESLPALPRLKQALLRPLDPWDMDDVITHFPSYVQGLFLASWSLCASKSQVHVNTQ